MCCCRDSSPRSKLLLDVREGAVVVPSKAVIIEKGGAFIYVIRPDNVAERRFIELGPETDNMMIVERGLIPGNGLSWRDITN